MLLHYRLEENQGRFEEIKDDETDELKVKLR